MIVSTLFHHSTEKRLAIRRGRVSWIVHTFVPRVHPKAGCSQPSGKKLFKRWQQGPIGEKIEFEVLFLLFRKKKELEDEETYYSDYNVIKVLILQLERRNLKKEILPKAPLIVQYYKKTNWILMEMTKTHHDAIKTFSHAIVQPAKEDQACLHIT